MVGCLAAALSLGYRNKWIIADAPLNCLPETISQHPALRHGVEALEAGGHGLQAMQIVAW
jgi:hypothetical protein